MRIVVTRHGASAELPIGSEEKDLYLGMMAAADFISENPAGGPVECQVVFNCRSSEDVSRLCKSLEEIVALWVTGEVNSTSLNSPVVDP